MPVETSRFLYSEPDARVPQDVVRARVHPSVTAISASAFYGREKLKRIELPEGLVEIGAHAFWGCRSLIRVDFPSTIKKIGACAFACCDGLEALCLPEGLTEVEPRAFSRCSRLSRIEIPSTVRVVPAGAFLDCGRLEEAMLRDGPTDIGERAFQRCCRLRRIDFPSSLRAIGRGAFDECNRLEMPDGPPATIERVGTGAFGRTRLQRLRMPPSLTEVPNSDFASYQCAFSVELPEGVGRVGWGAFRDCGSLRNVAVPKGAFDTEFSVGGLVMRSAPSRYRESLDGAEDLLQLFGSCEAARKALMERFDGLPIHSLCYYQSYHRDTLERLHIAFIKSHERENRPSLVSRTLWNKSSLFDRQQDCLGMTPLHILACSATRCLELYQIIIEKYPNSLVTKDRWGDVPLFYAIWGNAPKTVTRFLATRQIQAFPGHELNLEKMLVTLTMANSPLYIFQNLFDMHHAYFPERGLDWKYVFESLSDFTNMVHRRCDYISEDISLFLLQNCLSKRVDAIGVKRWRNMIAKRIEAASRVFSSAPFVSYLVFRQNILVCRDVVSFEHEYEKLKEITTLLELALWKARMEEANSSKCLQVRCRGQKIGREGCRVCSGAAVIIPNVFPYLVPVWSQFSTPVKCDEKEVEDGPPAIN